MQILRVPLLQELWTDSESPFSSVQENRNPFSEEVRRGRWLTEVLMADLAHFSPEGKCLILVEGTLCGVQRVTEEVAPWLRSNRLPEVRGAYSHCEILRNVWKIKLQFSLERAETAGAFFRDNIATKWQNAALKVLMYLPTSTKSDCSFEFFFPPSPNKFCMLQIP